MRIIDVYIGSREDAERYILECEKRFSDNIDEALEGVFTGDPVKTIALAGPTCSGKTTTAEKLVRRIQMAGKRAVVLSIDDFFLSRNDRNVVDGEAPDYDSVAALDLEYLEYFMKRLNAGLPVLVPHYDFSSTGRTGYWEYIPHEEDIYLFEGIQAVYPEVTRLFEAGYRSIFINVNEDVRYGNVVLEKEEIRLLRRTVRDRLFRGATPEFTLHLWETVRENEEKNIFPNAGKCQLHLESFLEYEPFLLARYGVEMLDSVPLDSRYRPAADEVLHELRGFDCPYFEESMVPKISLFREFIGGKE